MILAYLFLAAVGAAFVWVVLAAVEAHERSTPVLRGPWRM